jgi:protein tyrosine/serine phosphatase
MSLEIEVVPGKIWRGAQPVGIEWRRLRDDYHIRTVLKLNYPEEGSDNEALTLGMRVIECPMPPKDLIGAVGMPDINDVANAVAALADSTNWPMLVHCEHGRDRTGIVVGEYRVLHEGWRPRAAFEEMCRLGFHATLPDLLLTWALFCMEHQR